MGKQLFNRELYTPRPLFMLLLLTRDVLGVAGIGPAGGEGCHPTLSFAHSFSVLACGPTTSKICIGEELIGCRFGTPPYSRLRLMPVDFGHCYMRVLSSTAMSFFVRMSFH